MTATAAKTATVSDQDVQALESLAKKNLQPAKLSEVMMAVPSVVQRGAIYLISAAVIFSLCLLYFGKVHVVVAAKGKIVPKGESILVPCLEGGVVTEVLARPGDRLAAGDSILRVDRTQSGMSLDSIKRKLDLQETELEQARLAAAETGRILENPQSFLAEDKEPGFTGTTAKLVNAMKKAWLDLSNIRQNTAQSFSDKKRNYLGEIEFAREKIQLLEKVRKAAAKNLERDEEELSKKKENLESARRLAERGITSSREYEQERERYRAAELALGENRNKLNQMGLDISNEGLRLSELQSKVKTEEIELDTESRLALINFRQSLANLREGADDLNSQIKKLETALQDTRDQFLLAESQLVRTSVQMPVAGTVVKIDIKNPGELVGNGQVVATIVPEGAPLVVSATVMNKDIGFVSEGLEAQIKVDAYPFQQFGVVPGRVVKVFPNAGADENFTIIIELIKDEIDSGASKIRLIPGLTVQAELLTSKQRLFNLLLSKGSGDQKGGGSK